MDGLKWLAVIASYIGLVIMLIGLGIKRIRKTTAQDIKSESHDEKFVIMEKKIEKDSKHHEVEIAKINSLVKIEIAKIHGLIEVVRKENNTQYAMYTKNNSEQHGKIFDKIEVINTGISEIKGYLKAKQEV